ncbi:vacuolar iron transporter homolog 4-like [Telopea speciosissima]|uniref:vacuolar iron transporter homolog 4-like n=1 Tax=Telopea speciosissima TaxID=54955 RepID=UPI001CC80F5C|nr:vacuolar iron transporter homolog 4-like [Telopea speciosissima]
MAVVEPHPQPALSDAKLRLSAGGDVERQIMRKEPKEELYYFIRTLWVRAAVLGANSGLVSSASLMIGLGAVRQESHANIISCFAAVIGWIVACVSDYLQFDIEMAQIWREKQKEGARESTNIEESKKLSLPNLINLIIKATIAYVIVVSIGILLPLLPALFIRKYKVMLGVVAAGVSSFALLVVGVVRAVLWRAAVWRSCVRVLLGGWLAMVMTFGLAKLISSIGF